MTQRGCCNSSVPDSAHCSAWLCAVPDSAHCSAWLSAVPDSAQCSAWLRAVPDSAHCSAWLSTVPDSLLYKFIEVSKVETRADMQKNYAKHKSGIRLAFPDFSGENKSERETWRTFRGPDGNSFLITRRQNVFHSQPFLQEIRGKRDILKWKQTYT